MSAESIPYTCPHCETVTWAREDAVTVRCRYCGQIWYPPRDLTSRLTNGDFWLCAVESTTSRRLRKNYPGDSVGRASDTGGYLHTLKFRRTAGGCFA